MLTRSKLIEHGELSRDRTALRAITHLQIESHSDETGTIHYETTSGHKQKLIRLADAEVVYLLLREHVSKAVRSQQGL